MMSHGISMTMQDMHSHAQACCITAVVFRDLRYLRLFHLQRIALQVSRVLTVQV
jgi:hypothetical protein